MTIPRDPDLEQAVDEFRYLASRVRQLQEQVARADEVKEYRDLAARRYELAEIHEQFATRGEKLRLAADRRTAGRTLLIVTEEVSRWRDRYRRRPSPDQLHAQMTIAARNAETARIEAAAEATFAIYARKVATQTAAAAASAVAYLEASR